jgi:NADPH:quinone reductase
MKAALCKSLDGPDSIVIEDLPDPVAGPGQVVVRVKAAALNFLDTLTVRGKYQVKPEMPFSPASEFAGVVDSVGEGVTSYKPGDRVTGYLGSGAAREKVVVPALSLMPTPDGVSDPVAASLVVTYATGLHGLRDRGQLKAGETLVVLGASGGAGLAAVELGKLMGARVIAAASSDEKLAVCKEHGADVLINYATADLKQAIRDATGGKGADVIYDCVGGPHAEAALRSIAWNGRFLVIGFAAGEIPKIALNLLLLKSSSLVGVFWGEHARRDPKGNYKNLKDLMGWLAEGKIRPHVFATYPLAQTVDALRALDQRKSTGKVVITM